MFLTRDGNALSSNDKLYVEDVFSAFNFTGDGASNRTIANGIDLSTKGGLVWLKRRGVSAGSHSLWDTTQGVSKFHSTDTTSAPTTEPAGYGVSSFLTNGFVLGQPANNVAINQSPDAMMSWTFRKAAKFFDVKTYTGNSAANRVVAHDLGITPGMVIIKRTNSGTSDWVVFHRKDFTKTLRLNTTAAETSTVSITANDTQITLSGSLTPASDINESSGIYVAYFFAHDTSTDGIIQCGSYTGNAQASNTINLGWEAQYVLIKPASGGTGHWFIYDTARGLCLNSDATLAANGSFTEADFGTQNYIEPCANGFRAISNNNATNGAGFTYVYMAIRKGLMRPPTDATKVFAVVARAGTSAAATVTAGSITQGVDLAITKSRNGNRKPNWQDRLRGPLSQLFTSDTAAQETRSDELTAFNMTGVTFGASSFTAQTNWSADNYINYFLKQARGFFDIVGYTGTGVAHAEAHNLGVAPEFMIFKRRNTTNNWMVYANDPTKAMCLNINIVQTAGSGFWNDTAPTPTAFTIGNDLGVNASASTYIAYLFATLAGVSKVDTYTGTGALKQINCGFSAGARFVLVKRTDSIDNWYVWDSTRGIISGNDPYFLLNLTSAEFPTTDHIDPYSQGFELPATSLVNDVGASYFYLAIA